MFFAHIIAIQFAYSHCVPPLKFKGIENTELTKPTFVLEWILILLQGVLSVRFLENKTKKLHNKTKQPPRSYFDFSGFAENTVFS